MDGEQDGCYLFVCFFVLFDFLIDHAVERCLLMYVQVHGVLRYAHQSSDITLVGSLRRGLECSGQ